MCRRAAGAVVSDLLGQALFALGLVLSIGSLFYVAGATLLLHKWRKRHLPSAAMQPPVTVLKPLCGLETDLYTNLRSFCTQDYPHYQVVFGLRNGHDPAAPVVQRLMREFPELDLELVIDERVWGSNYKVSNLANMLPHARHAHLVIADSDIRVGPRYLRGIVASLTEPGVGIVTCLYKGRACGSLWSRLGALFINEWFIPSVLCARALGADTYVFGATMALHRSTLDAIGGFAALRSYLADDYMLGELVRRQGLRVALSPYLVETLVDEPRARGLIAHELRWARTVRTVQPWGYAGAGLTHALPVSLIAAGLVHHLPWSAALPGLALVLRLMLHAAARRSLHSEPAPGAVWVIPLREALSFAIWLGSFTSRRVRWREQALSVHADGRMQVEKE